MTASTESKDLDTLIGEPTVVTLESGYQVSVERLKTRQLLRLLRIITTGAGDGLRNLTFDPDNSDDFAQTILATVLFAVPAAEDETLEFITSMVTPTDLNREPKSKAEREKNAEVFEEFQRQFLNPEIEDTLAVLEVIITNEAPHILQLGKRLAELLKVQQKNLTAKTGAAAKKKAPAKKD